MKVIPVAPAAPLPGVTVCGAPAGFAACFDMGTHRRGEPAVVRQFEIQNDGTVPLAIDSLDFLTSIPALWLLDSADCRGRILQAGQSCIITVTFIPPANPAAANIGACGYDLSWPNTTPLVPNTQTAMVKNTDTIPAHVLSKTLTQFFPGDYTVTDGVPAVMEPGVAYPVHVTLQPQAGTDSQGRYVIKTDSNFMPEIVVCFVVVIVHPTVGGTGGTRGTKL